MTQGVDLRLKPQVVNAASSSQLASQIQQCPSPQRQDDQNADGHVIESMHGIAPASHVWPL